MGGRRGSGKRLRQKGKQGEEKANGERQLIIAYFLQSLILKLVYEELPLTHHGLNLLKSFREVL